MRYLRLLLMLFIVPTVLANKDPEIGQDIDRILTLDQALLLVLEKSPELQAYEYQTAAATALIKGARMSKPFHASLSAENLSSENPDGSDPMETTLSLSKIFELGGKSSLRGEIASRNAELMRDDQHAKHLDILSNTMHYFLDVLSAQEHVSIKQEAVLLAQQTLVMVKRRVKAGGAPRAEQYKANIALTQANLEAARARREFDSSKVNLSVLWGETVPRFTSAKGALLKTYPTKPFEFLETQLSRNPQLVRLATSKRLSEVQLQLAKAKRKPDIEFSLGARQFKETGEMAYVFSTTIPLGSGRRARSSIIEAELLDKREALRIEKHRLDLTAALYKTHQAVQQAYETSKGLRSQIIPQSEKAMQEYKRGYRSGRYSFIELTDAQQSLLTNRLNLISTAANFHHYRIEIDRLTGATLPDEDHHE